MTETEALLEPERTETPGASPAPAWTATLLLASLCIAAYAPAFNNGFIADDYVILQRTEILKTVAIAKAAAVTVPGWQPELIEDGETGATCSDCVVLRWDAKNMRYVR